MTLLSIGMESEEVRDTMISEVWGYLEATFHGQDTYDGSAVETACAEFMAQAVEFASGGVFDRGDPVPDLRDAATTYVDRALDDFVHNGGCLDQLPAILDGYRRYCEDCRERGIKFVLCLDPAESYMHGGFAILRDCDGIEFDRVMVDVQAYSEANYRELLEHGHGD